MLLHARNKSYLELDLLVLSTNQHKRLALNHFRGNLAQTVPSVDITASISLSLSQAFI